MNQESYTGRKRSRKTPRSVRRAEVAAKAFIFTGGFGTILAVSLIFGFLLWVVVPLFGSGDLAPRATVPVESGRAGHEVLASNVDEYRLMTWLLYSDGHVRVLRLDDGSTLEDRVLFEQGDPTAVARTHTPDGERIVIGFADGSVRSGSLAFSSRFLPEDAIPEELKDLAQGSVARSGNSMVQRTPEGQLRATAFSGHFDDPIPRASTPIVRIDISVLPSGAAVFATLDREGHLALCSTRERANMFTGETTVEFKEVALPYVPPGDRGLPEFVKLGGIGNLLYLIWEDGFTQRYDTRDAAHAAVAETLDLTEGDVRVTEADFMVGKTTLLVGDSAGHVGAWFPIKPADADTIDGVQFVEAHRLEGPASPVTSLAPSPRSRLAAAGYGNGKIRLFFVTTDDLIGEVDAGAPVLEAVVTPKQDGLVAITADGLVSWDYHAAYPEASLTSLFGKVWYEGYPEPEYAWQSTGGTDDFEPKLSLVPLVIGTLKATFYSMLIALPIALLAAVFTSEFMRPSARAPIKSVIELMAGLPSVVLGFLAALVLAPFVAEVLPATMSAFLTIPLAVLLGARLWQLLPQRLALRWSGLPRLLGISIALAFGVLLAALLGPVFERLFFAGDFRAWLASHDSDLASRAGGWSFLLMPTGLLIAALLFAQFVNPWLRGMSTGWSRSRCANMDLLRLAGLVFAAALVAAALAYGLSRLGLDPRGTVVGTYMVRNALIVGFVMGFAIVPIIYTLAEDALSSVPSQLREGSLGAGATPWQTAVRSVIPTAMSGLFSAVMVGLGRAVGETMIVLMAAGGEPIMKWNMFNGFRTLSANIATELPEAVRNSAHYRTLFLAALVLFAMTFLLNTLAEWVRRRFRRRYTEQL